jgi:hypothetical protein
VSAVQPARFLYVPYRIARLPLAVVDRRVARHLGADSPVRMLSLTGLVLVDRAAAALFDESPLPHD